ncbi:MAG: D-glycero-beta-D-manno-heptose 1,7-bisphosphate 7-phosphatase [Pseudomonadales bacterium]
MTAKNFVILDRDGVVNLDSPKYIKSPDEWRPVPGSLEAIALLTQEGYEVYVATNQSGVARGLLSLDLLGAIHERMQEAAIEAGGRITDIRFCPHHPDDQCDCRKPEPGMLLDLANAHGLSLKGNPYVGDSLADLDCADAVGCLPVLVRTGNGEKTLQQRPRHQPVYDDLLAFVQTLVGG